MARIVDEAIDYLTDRNTHIPPVISILALIGLGRIARLASFGLAALWVADQVRNIDRDRSEAKPKKQEDRMIDTAMEDSFPASDPPSYSSSVTGTPDETVREFLTVH